jgi:uracil-DNA glycosylase family 4
MFTGDRSGEFLYRALWEAGFASRPESITRGDGLELRDAYITAPVRCVPPDNKPAREEIFACRPYLERELIIFEKACVVVVLGSIALAAYLSILRDRGSIPSCSGFPFGHGREFLPVAAGPVVLTSYHPSQQNTSTKRLTASMLREVFLRARALIDEPRAQGRRV